MSLPPSPPSASSAAVYQHAQKHLPGGNTRTTLFVAPHPPYAIGGEGYLVTDADGHTTIDLHANMSALVHGHAHPGIIYAISRTLGHGLSLGLPTESEVALAATLTERVQALEIVRFANSGTEAVMALVRLARAYTGRTRVLRYEHCYHGTYDAVLRLGSPGVPPSVTEDVITLPYGDISASEAAIREAGGELACVLVDLMPNRAGLVPADEEFVFALRACTHEVGALLIIDEVITFRCEYGGLQSVYNVHPDLMAFGKVIGGGLPVGAFGGRADVMELFDPRHPEALEHGGTFTANPLTMTAGRAALELLTSTEITRINALGNRLRESLSELGFRVAGRGSLIRIFADDMDDLWWRLYRAGVLIGRNGLMCISTPMDDATVDQILERSASIIAG